MTISPEYAEELGRQIDELEAENERLRSLIPTEPQESPVSEFKRDGIARCLFDKAMSGLAQWDEMTEPNKEDWRLLADAWILETTSRIEMIKGFRASPLPRPQGKVT